ncbi:acyl-CoA dehydrogenase family protein [Streptomyces sp. NPDC089799]|uniref:acyl-CoA dehydrogenase family protein n=1 Tax=Streptomyces sp. NPDC089799 TaxID=3155066 RepID=UPI003448B4E5
MFLQSDRAVLDELLPGLDQELAKRSLDELEAPGNEGLQLFKEAGGTGLLIPTEHGGLGASARASVQCTRALGTRSPSLAVAATMHNFSVASLVEVAHHSDGFEWMLLDAIANDRLLLSSAFAEGRSGQGVLSPKMTARRQGAEWVVNGRKKPCSLSRSMDLITASVALHDGDAEPQLGFVLVPAKTAGIRVVPFWNSAVLTGAESDEVILEDVVISDELVVRPDLDPDSHLDNVQTVGLIWFSLLVGASYLGVAGALAERLRESGRDDRTCTTALLDLEGAGLALDRVAWGLDTGEDDNHAVARALTARYTAQDAARRVADACVEALGGIGFVSSPDVAYLVGATHAAQFHPPSRRSALSAFSAYFDGEPLRVD